MPMTFYELSERHQDQIRMAATGCISGTLVEWPHLYWALEKLGHKVSPDMTAIEVKRICRRIVYSRSK